jgi:ankyrin repeat protein
MNFYMQAMVAFLILILVRGSGPLGWFEAAKMGDLDRVNEFIENGADINLQIGDEYYNFSALMFASAAGHFEVARLLIENGASVDIEDDTGITALTFAAINGHVSIVRLLIKNGAIINPPNEYDDFTTLGEAAKRGHVDVIRLLIDNGAHVNQAGFGERTALDNASIGGHFEIAKLLIENGATVNHLRSKGESALTDAVLGGYIEIVKLLIENGAFINHADELGFTALDKACTVGNVAILGLLFEGGATINHAHKAGFTALAEASYVGNLEIVRFLINIGANVNIADASGRTAVHRASLGGHVEIVRLLIENRADVSRVDRQGWTALVSAAKEGHVEVVELLIENGATISAASVSAIAEALKQACRKRAIRVSELLIENGASVDTIDLNERSALSEASEKGDIEIMKILLTNGADINREIPWREGSDAAIVLASREGKLDAVRLLLDYGADVRLGNPLMFAAERGNTEIVSLLLSKMADVDAETLGIQNALNRAAERGHIDCMTILIAHGANVNSSIYGNTPLMVAARAGQTGAVRFLLKQGAEHTTCNQSAVIEAAFNGKTQVARLLIESGAVETNQKHVFDFWFKSPELVRMLVLGGIHLNSVLPLRQRLSITDPLDSIQLATDYVTSAENALEVYSERVEANLVAKGLFAIQGLLSFSFNIYTRGMRVLEKGSGIYRRLMDHVGWTEERVNIVHQILNQLSVRGCSLMNFTFIVAPALEMEDIGTLKRLSLALEILEPETGNIINKMIQRSSTVGFRPVIKALYSHFMDMTAVRQGRSTRGFADVIYGKVSSYQNLTEILFEKLALAIERHYER